MRSPFAAALLIAAAAFAGAPAFAQVNAGAIAAESTRPFTVTPVAQFNWPWGLAALADGRFLVGEKPGKLWIVTAKGAKTPVTGVPKVLNQGQGGLLAIAPAPSFARDRTVFLTYSEPGAGGSGLALARARLAEAGGTASLAGLQVIWRQLPKGDGGQFGGYIAFSPDGRFLFLTSGDRMRKTPAQDPKQALGKVLRLTLDGKPAPGNPAAAKGGVEAETWTTGHRNQYGLAFDRGGRLWEVEMGPMGGDELNLLRPGRNYGWPVVSYGINYDSSPIPQHPTRPEFEEPVVYWTPVIAPAGFAFYDGALFPAWRGSAFIGGLRSQVLVRVAFDGKGGAHQADRWDMGAGIRNIVPGADGALWAVENSPTGHLIRLAPK